MEVPDMRKYPYDTSLGRAANLAKYGIKHVAKKKALELAMKKAYMAGDQKKLDALTKASGISGEFKDVVLHYNKAVPLRYNIGEMDVPLIKKSKKAIKRKLKK